LNATETMDAEQFAAHVKANRAQAIGLQLEMLGFRVSYEHKFHPRRKWRLDVYGERGKLRAGIEIHGATFANGRHTRGMGFAGDREKMNEAALCGIVVLEYTTEQFGRWKYICDQLGRLSCEEAE
jgi:hypothetical protein